MVAILILIAGIIAPDEGMTFGEVLNISSEYLLDACQWGLFCWIINTLHPCKRTDDSD